jgi:tRNA (guanosine-2'-O-)-methyltransferase
LSAIAREEADAAYHIPMVGFTESFNVSVSAALSMQHILQRMKEGNHPWQLPDRDQKYLLAKWMISDVHKPQLHLKQAFTKTSSS